MSQEHATVTTIENEEKNEQIPKSTLANPRRARTRRPFWTMFGDWRTEDHRDEFVLA